MKVHLSDPSSQSTNSNPRKRALIPLLIVIVTALVFARTIRHEFTVWDDEANIVESPYMQPINAANAIRMWREPYFAMYIPVTRTVWAGLGTVSAGPKDLAGKVTYNPWPFHAANLLVHCINALLVFFLVKRFVRREWAAALGALLFAVHPMQVEPVAWVTGMKDLLGACLSLASMHCYIRWASQPRADSPRKSGRWNYALATMFFGLALLAKPAAAVLPAILFVIDSVLLKRTIGASARALLPWAAAAIPIAVITRAAEQATGAVPKVALWARPLIMGDTMAWYLRTLAWPGSTSVDYGRTPEAVLHSPLSYVVWIVPVALGIIVLARRAAYPPGPRERAG